MPYKWIEPELFLEFAGVAVYHTYDDNDAGSYYWYTTDPSDDNRDWAGPDKAQFDVRELPTLGLDVNDFEKHAAIIQNAIRKGLITGEPSPQSEIALTVKIEVRKGVAYVVEQPPGVEVKIIDYDVVEEDD